MQDLSRKSIATSEESVSTYHRRPKAEAFNNVVDVVERLRDPTNYFHWVYDHRRFYSSKQNNNYSLTLNE